MRDCACQVILATGVFFRSVRVVIASVRFRIILEIERERGAPSYFSRVRFITSPLPPKETSCAIFPSSKSTPPSALLFSSPRTRDAIYQRDPHPRAGERGFIAIIQQTKGKRERERERERVRGYVLIRYSASFILLSRDSVV